MIKWTKKEKVAGGEASIVDKGLARVHRFVLKLATYLQARSNVLSTKTKVILLFTFVLLFCTGSAVVLYTGIAAPSAQSLAVTKMKVVPLQPKEQPTRITSREYIRVQRFKAYIDSLGETRSGRRLRDSLLWHRPKLMDSVNALLQLYSQQNKQEDDENTNVSH